MENKFLIKFDASMQESTSGACFTIQVRDHEHAKLVIEWLKSKSSNCHILLEIQSSVTISV